MWRDFLESEGIFCYGELDVKDLLIWNENKFRQTEEKIGKIESAAVFLIPYFSGQKTTNLSVYAQPRDYHLFVKELSHRFSLFLQEKGVDLKFCMFADSSPIGEREAALRAGLGFLGKNGLVINRRYGSYFFIGEIFFIRAFSPQEPCEIQTCNECGICIQNCPTGAILDEERTRCLSLISQKKEWTEEEKTLLDRADCKWGCDLCQTSCPFNVKAEKTPIPFFQTELISRLTEKEIDLPKKEFLQRAFSWRGKNVLRRNIRSEKSHGEAERNSYEES